MANEVMSEGGVLTIHRADGSMARRPGADVHAHRMDEWGLATEVAARQHYAVATWQMGLLGISRGALADRVARQRWRRNHRGVVQLPGPVTPAGTLAAAVLAYSRPVRAAQRVADLVAEGVDFVDAVAEAALGCGQAVCGPSALWLHGVDDLLVPLAPTPGGLDPRHAYTEEEILSSLSDLIQRRASTADPMP